MRIGPALIVLGTGLLAGCSFSASAGKFVGKSEVEHQLSTQLAAKTGEQPKAVVCPGDLKAKVGTTMRCRLDTPEGPKYGVLVTVRSVDGGKTNFDFQVDKKPTTG